MSSESGDFPVTRQRAPRKVIAAGALGTTLEFYDFILYGLVAALVFGELFFPNAAPGAGTLLALSTFAVGFIARPIGGALFGHFGDRIGRKNTLLVTLLIMGFATLFIGLLPTYEAIGIWAPISLVALRIIQGIGVGGEWGGAVLLIGEHGDSRRRGFATSFAQLGSPAGTLFASLAVLVSTAVTTEEQFAAWGWRMPFLLGFLAAVVGLYLRLQIRESPVFEEVEQRQAVARVPLMDLLKNHWRALAVAVGVTLASFGAYYVFTVVSLSYLGSLDVNSSVGPNGNLIGAVLALPIVLLVGALSDRIGRRPMYVVGAIFVSAWAFAFFPLLATESSPLIFVAVAVGLVGWAVLYGVQGAFLSELFPSHVRYTGAGLAYQIAGVFGGFVPLISVFLLNTFDTPVAISSLVAATGLATLLAVAVAPETLRASEPHTSVAEDKVNT